jgi:hypothetical protein
MKITGRFIAVFSLPAACWTSQNMVGNHHHEHPWLNMSNPRPE